MTAHQPSARQRVLVVEDEQHILAGLQFNLEAEGYIVETAETGEDALDALLNKKTPFDVVVLDVMLPGKDGFAVVSELRAAGEFVPTLMLTARGRPEDVLAGFAAGADDYLPKPFELAILLARLQGLLRRKRWMAPSATPAQGRPSVFSFDGKSVHFDLQELRVGDQVYPLTLMEVNILRYLVEREGQSISRKTMLQDVWGLREDTDTRAIDNFIVRLRRYLESDPARPRHLLTVRGVGYRFVAFPQS
jgi:DNA-binding response OmpR family regulator